MRCGLLFATLEEETGAPRVGTTVGGKFILREVIGAGAMGTVYRADQVTLGRTVAVKLLNASLARDATMVERFEKEARAASRLNHPNTISIFDFGQTDDGLLYIVMEFVRGRTLTEVILQDFPLPPARFVDIGCQILAGLHEAHSQGVIHQDVKPDNVLVERLRTGGDLVKIADFGIARLREEEPVLKDGTPIICGTPEYMAPEQIQGKPVDAQSDIYAVGVVLYEMLVGARPFSGNQVEVLRAHIMDQPPIPSTRRPEIAISPQIEAAVMRALAKDPAARYESAAEFRAELEACVSIVRTPGLACPSCATITPAGSAFCPKCGVRLGAEQVVTVDPTSPTLAQITTQPQGAPRPLAISRFPLPFLGREPELAFLERQLWSRERSRTVLVTGPPGIGKTRLVTEAASRLASRGFRIVVFEPDPTGLASAWYPVRTAVSALLGLPQDVSRAALQSACANHGIDAGNVLGLSELFGLQPHVTGLELAVRRRECMAAALEVLRGGREQPPTLLVFEDVDRYDRPSFDVLHRLAQFPGETPVHLLLTSVSPGPFESLPTVEILPLGGLAEDACHEVVRHVLGTSPGASELAQRLCAGCHGAPLHIEQALRSALEGVGGGETRSLGDIVGERVDRLPLHARRVLQLVSVFGMEAPEEPLFEIMAREGVSRRSVEDAVEDLVARGFVRRRAGWIPFAHHLVQELVYAGIPVDARREFHEAVYTVLVSQGGVPASVAGFHGFAAGGGDRVLENLERAGLDAQRMFDDAGAMMHFQRGWQLARWRVLRGEVEAEPVMARLGLALGEAMRFAGDLVGAEGVLRETLERCGGDHGIAARVFRALGQLAAFSWHQPERGLEHVRTALGHALRSGQADTIAEMYLDLATMLQRQGDLRSAASELDEGIMMVTGGDGPTAERGPALLWRVLIRRAEIALALGDTGGAATFAKAALQQAERTGSPVGLARTHAVLADILTAEGRAQEAARHRLKAVDWMRDLGDRRSTAQLLAALAQQELAKGASEEARARLAEARKLAAAVDELT